MEQHGAVFLPAAGYRYGASVNNVGSGGYYWSASYLNSYDAWYVGFYDSGLSTGRDYYRFSGQSVRLVRSSQDYTFTITASANPTEYGSVSGGGEYAEGAECTLTATANEGYTFINWTETIGDNNPKVVSTSATYTFRVQDNRNLVANFKLEGTVSNSAFSVRDGYQVLFSKGNLQYIGSAGNGDENNAGAYWKFAENQWDILGDNGQGSDSKTVDRDLFGWGTSGYNHGAAYYEPWSTSATNSDYYAYGNYEYNLYDETGKADWGVHNAISNGGNTAGTWRTLTQPEWDYLFNTRTTASGIRYVMACVNNINGMILLPDDWSADYYNLGSTNSYNASYSANQIDSTQWTTLEQHGAVFLPAAGYRNETFVSYVGSFGHYWSASYYNSNRAWDVFFYGSNLSTDYYGNRCYGRSVRLVRSSQVYTFTITASANPTEYGTVSAGGTFAEGEICTLTATANEGYAFVNWTETIGDDNSKVVSTSATYTFRVQDNRTLVANFEVVPIPTGAINGKFTVNANGGKVYFSQGNLQYIGSATPAYWRFAENQWDYLGNNGQGSGNQTVDRDLFGWGTSGYNHGATCYQPWSTSTTSSDYYAYGNYEYNLNDSTGQADWGYNAISNGGNTENSGWRTLTHEEWTYLFKTRNTTRGIRYAKAKLNDINGVILLPDDWSSSYYALSNTNQAGASFSNNVITAAQWATLEQHGAVFLPAAGDRIGTSVNNVGSDGNYWSASCNNSGSAWNVNFYEVTLYTNFNYYRYIGQSVRLVRPVQ